MWYVNRPCGGPRDVSLNRIGPASWTRNPGTVKPVGPRYEDTHGTFRSSGGPALRTLRIGQTFQEPVSTTLAQCPGKTGPEAGRYWQRSQRGFEKQKGLSDKADLGIVSQTFRRPNAEANKPPVADCTNERAVPPTGLKPKATRARLPSLSNRSLVRLIFIIGIRPGSLPGLRPETVFVPRTIRRVLPRRAPRASLSQLVNPSRQKTPGPATSCFSISLARGNSKGPDGPRGTARAGPRVPREAPVAGRQQPQRAQNRGKPAKDLSFRGILDFPSRAFCVPARSIDSGS